MSDLRQMIATNQDCTSDLKFWITRNNLQLSEDKTGSVCRSIQIQKSSLAAKFYLHQWYQYFFFTSGPQPRSHPWSNTHLQTAHFKHLHNCLFWTQKNQFSPLLSLCWCHKNTRVFLCSVKAWVLQLSSSWISKVSFQETSENQK